MGTRRDACRHHLPPRRRIRTHEVEHHAGALTQRPDRLRTGDVGGEDLGLVDSLLGEHPAHLVRVAPGRHPPRIGVSRARGEVCDHSAPGDAGRTQHRNVDVSGHVEKLTQGRLPASSARPRTHETQAQAGGLDSSDGQP